MTAIRLLRHATLLVEYADTTLLIDPMLAEAGTAPPIQNSPNDRRNPLVDLPGDVDPDDLAFDALLVTHLHDDHLDDAAKERLAGHGGPTLCQPEDADELRETAFEDVRPVEEALELGDVTVTRTPARHGHGALAEAMAPVSGFVLEAPDEPTLYHAGDTVWYEGVAETLERFDPDVVVANAGAAQFTEGRPITMTAEDVVAICEATDARVVADHLDAINHCLQTRADLRAALSEAGVAERVAIPEDGETVTL
ncbi:MBL fold metallo-hydrolase [Salinirubellus salinus]|uniref:MBL fold metallo-hydrolase n=1 Tax=Salinirubellus salinus TaxID=1364945 RepID=A0A9E7R4Z5_9EURY|nr:MBL fold metallo-hydrolase [Salinirubellus salinus]UWM54760.1 MBL fold metallo-hydrolase [Salinirubellus salinus]